jgi:sortase A
MISGAKLDKHVGDIEAKWAVGFSRESLKSALLSAIWLTCLVGGGLLVSNGAYMWAKAQLAQVLIASAWQNSVHVAEANTLSHNTKQTREEQAITTKPWPWADTYPVAKLTLPSQLTGSLSEDTLYVLAGASGRTMAFGPGHMSATPLPFEGGNSVITGHRDTHFAALQYLNNGDPIGVQTLKAQGQYRVTATFIVHQSQTHIIESQGADQLTLITCYPFNSMIPNPTMRYVVSAERVR